MSAAGKFRELVTFYQPSPSAQDATGGFSTGTETAFTAWARVEQLAAEEVLVNNKLTYFQPYRITIRYRDEVTNVTRVEWKQVRISINSVREDEHRTEKILLGYGVS